MEVSPLVMLACFVIIRQQAYVGDRSFLRFMIPHHSSAILMCEQANIEDPEIIALCEQIIEAQRDEIAIMERMLITDE
ncbi:MAG: DUF305 domain-containing protein [Chloroflexi bacterium]|nr:DUF305 domain-containing protein [Chloroflexota bacterium]